jgi:hypothetical protein
MELAPLRGALVPAPDLMVTAIIVFLGTASAAQHVGRSPRSASAATMPWPTCGPPPFQRLMIGAFG